MVQAALSPARAVQAFHRLSCAGVRAEVAHICKEACGCFPGPKVNFLDFVAFPITIAIDYASTAAGGRSPSLLRNPGTNCR